VRELIGNLSDALGQKPVITNLRIARLVLLLNQNPELGANGMWLRIKQAGPAKVAVALVNAYGRFNAPTREDILHEVTVKHYDKLFNQISSYATRLDAIRQVATFWSRVRNRLLEEHDGSKLKLRDDYVEYLVTTLSSSQDFQLDNTYFKGISTTLGCAVITEKNPWLHSRVGIAREATDILRDSGILTSVRAPDAAIIASTHIEPLHYPFVKFYNTDKSKLGIPSVSPWKPSDVDTYNPPEGLPIPTNADQIVSEIAAKPFFSAQGIVSRHGRRSLQYITEMSHLFPDEFPLTTFTSDDGKEIIASRKLSSELQEIVRRFLPTTILEPEIAAVHPLAAELFYQQSTDEDEEVVERIGNRLLEEQEISADRIVGKEASVLYALENKGIIEYGKNGKYKVVNLKPLGVLVGLLESNIGKISNYIEPVGA